PISLSRAPTGPGRDLLVGRTGEAGEIVHRAEPKTERRRAVVQRAVDGALPGQVGPRRAPGAREGKSRRLLLPAAGGARRRASGPGTGVAGEDLVHSDDVDAVHPAG